jgi:hypothetical protein
MGWASITIRCARRGELSSRFVLIYDCPLCRHTLTQSRTTPLITAMLCVRFGVQCATRTNALSPSFLSVATTTPLSSYVISSPGFFSNSWCTVGGSDHGGPAEAAGLCVGNSRQTSTPSGASRDATRDAHFGRREGGRAHRNYKYQHLVPNTPIAFQEHTVLS